MMSQVASLCTITAVIAFTHLTMCIFNQLWTRYYDLYTAGGSRYVPGSGPQKAASGQGYDPFTGMYVHVLALTFVNTYIHRAFC